MALEKVSGVVLKAMNYMENDKIITLLTDKNGKVDAIVHGARRPRGQLMAVSQPFCYSEYILYRGKNMYTLKDASVIDSFKNILNDYEKIIFGSYYLEFIEAISTYENKNVSLLALLLKTLYLLNDGNIDNNLLKLTFDFKAVSLSGYMPQVLRCIKCGSIVEDGSFNVEEGGVVCRNCNSREGSFPLNRENYELLKTIRNIKLEDLRNIKYEKRDLLYLQNIIEKYIESRIEKKFKSKELLKNN